MRTDAWFMVIFFMLLIIGIDGCKDRDRTIDHFSKETITSSSDVSLQQKKLPSFVLPVAGQNVLYDSHQDLDKIRLVVFFAPWCSSCFKELSEIQKIQNEYGKDKLSVIAISVGDKFDIDMKTKGLSFPVLLGDDMIKNAFGPIMGVPTGFLADKSGLIVRKYNNHIRVKTLLEDINALLEN